MSGAARVLGALALVALAAGCHKSHGDDGAASAVVVEPPVAAPEGILAEIAMPSPDAAWARLQRGVGGPAGLLPSTLGGIAVSASRVDPSLGPEIDGASPAFAVFAGAPGDTSWVVAMHLADARGARGRLVDGDVAHFHARDVAGLSLLEPVTAVPKARGASVVVALSRGGYLVLARDEASLAALGPYATRTMPARPLAAEAVAIDVPGAALAGAVRGAIARAWSARQQAMIASDNAMRAEHAGKAPDYGDPQAIVTSLDAIIQARLAVLGDLKSLHVGVDPGATDLRAVITAVPASDAGPARQAMDRMHPGDLAPVLALPRDTAVAFFVRDDAAARASDATALDGAIDAALGARWTAVEAKRAHRAIDDWEHARGDSTALALIWGDATKGALVEAPAADGDRVTRAVEEAIDAFEKTPAIRAPFVQWLDVGDVSSGSLTLANGARATLATFTSAASKTRGSAPPRPGFVLGWTASNGDARVALGHATDVTTLLTAPAVGATLGDGAAMSALLSSVGQVAGALVLQPGRAPGCAGADGGAVMAWSRRAPKDAVGGADALWGALELSDTAVRCLVTSFL